MNYQTLQQSWPQFSNDINKLVARLGLDKLSLECDHCALRVNSTESAQLLVQAFEKDGQVISNNMINGRPILIIKLDQPLMLGEQAISCVELPFPSSKVYLVEGWEHIELVLPVNVSSCDELASELVARVPSLQGVLAGETDIKVKMSSPKGDNERLANPTIAFKHDNLCVKVHPHTIEAIIASE
ncbi:VOC family protein [Shewanella sp. WXL01]|uniref:VOC family protein n=1 Tax=Shewanella sp. WXL01 TaxID=2709721 RepID=UPI00143867A3|nr:VOC family protein [Shewanella sp. WXL01]NKF52481.1 VOC family protein [Shewanella sp. WXL01]